MAIQIQDYGMQELGSRLGAEIPQGGIYEYARGVSSEASGLMQLGQGLDTVFTQVENVKALGDVSDARGGLGNLSSDIWKDFELKGDMEDLPKRWREEFDARLNDYLPQNISDQAIPVVKELSQTFRREGEYEAWKRMDRSTVDKSYKAWVSEVNNSRGKGQIEASTRLVDAGRNIFIEDKEADQVQAALRQDVAWAPWKKAIEERPLELMSLIKSGDKSLPQDDYSRKRLEQEMAVKAKEMHSTYGQILLQNVKTLGGFAVGGLKEAEQYGFVSSTQRSRYEEAMRLAGESRKKQIAAPKLDASLACDLRLKMDQMGDDEFSKGQVAVEIATSGAAPHEFSTIYERFHAMKRVPQAIREELSREIHGLYSEGHLGGLKEAATLRRWTQLQDEVMSPLKDSSDGSIAAAKQVLALEKKKYGLWVTSSAMKARQQKQSTK